MNANGSADAGSIRQRAYELWELDGRPEGQEIDYWLRAEAALAREAGLPPEGRPPVAHSPDESPPGDISAGSMDAPDGQPDAAEQAQGQREQPRLPRKKVGA